MSQAISDLTQALNYWIQVRADLFNSPGGLKGNLEAIRQATQRIHNLDYQLIAAKKAGCRKERAQLIKKIYDLDDLGVSTQVKKEIANKIALLTDQIKSNHCAV